MLSTQTSNVDRQGRHGFEIFSVFIFAYQGGAGRWSIFRYGSSRKPSTGEKGTLKCIAVKGLVAGNFWMEF